MDVLLTFRHFAFSISKQRNCETAMAKFLSVKRRIQGNGMVFFFSPKNKVKVKEILHILYVKLKTEIHCCHMTSQFSFAWNVIRKGDPSYGIWIISLGALQT